MTPILGIDLGTTFSAAAFLDEEGRPRVIPNADGKSTTPSIVLIKDGKIEVGEPAMNRWIIDQEHVVRLIKRAMGDSQYRFQGLTAVQVSAEILKALKRDAETFFGESVTEAVITCPFYFNAVEIENTKIAGELAGFKVREIIKEPTAAAVYYGVENMKDGETVLTCDLGGGTFDATVLSYANDVFSPLDGSGDRRLGGHDWTMQLVELVSERFKEKFGSDLQDDLIAGQMLYEGCEQAKRDFARQTELNIPCQFQGRIEGIHVTRAEFEAKTEWLIRAMAEWSEKAVEKAGLKWRDINRILLVGGSSRLRRVGLALEEKSGRKTVMTAEPDLMVAYGAAVMAVGKVRPRKARGGLVDSGRAALVEVTTERIIARSLGTRVIMLEDSTARIVTSLIIPHGTKVPEEGLACSRDDFAVSCDGQPFFDVPVVEFESDDIFDPISNYRFTCAQNAKKGERITVTFHYDRSGIVTAEAVDRKTGRPLTMERVDYEEPNLDQVINRIRVKPRWVVFAIDSSGSMAANNKLDNAKQALLDNTRDLLVAADGTCKVGVVSFASTATVVCRPTSDFNELRRTVSSMGPDGGTAMDDGLLEALQLLYGAPSEADRDIVLLTDGEPNDPTSTLEAARNIISAGVTLCTLGIGSVGVNMEYLKSLTPLSLVIDTSKGMGQAMTTLLMQSAESRREGLLDA